MSLLHYTRSPSPILTMVSSARLPEASTSRPLHQLSHLKQRLILTSSWAPAFGRHPLTVGRKQHDTFPNLFHFCSILSISCQCHRLHQLVPGWIPHSNVLFLYWWVKIPAALRELKNRWLNMIRLDGSIYPSSCQICCESFSHLSIVNRLEIHQTCEQVKLSKHLQLSSHSFQPAKRSRFIALVAYA